MKSYISHKRVQAARILDVFAEPYDDGCVGVRLEGDGLRDLPPEMLTRYVPQPGDYLVRYADGYESISPRQAFEQGYSLAPPFDQSSGAME